MSNIILAIDTSINYCSVAIYIKKKIYQLSDICNKEHTIKILPMIHKILLITNTKLQEINYIAFAKGPGNFTSIRIATGIAQSLSLSLKIPILSVSTLAIMAEKAWRKYHQKKILVAIYASSKKLYWAQYIRYEKLLWIGEKTESLIHLHEINKKIKHLNNDWLFITNKCENINYKDFLKIKKIQFISPNAQDIIPFSIFNIKNKRFLHYTDVTPNYLSNIF